MAKFLALSLSLCILLFSGCFAFREQPQQNECQLERLNALKPDNRIESEAGLIETWNPNNEQFRCAGVALSRCTLQSNGLRRPFYSNAPQEIFIQQGNGIFGMIFPGCPETFQEPQESEQGKGSRFRDSHQKVHRFREGDVVAVPTGVVFWMYNDEDAPVVAVSLIDTSSYQNQLDQMPRRFYLAGNQEQEFLHYQHQRKEEEEDNEGSNIFSGFTAEFLEDVFNVNRHIVKKLQGKNEDEEKGAIVKVEGGLSVISPPQKQQQQRHQQEDEDEEEEEEEEEQQQQSKSKCQKDRRRHCRPGRRQRDHNGLEETICTARLRQNIGKSSSPDIYIPQAGSIKTVTSLDLPVLRRLRLSAAHGSLHKNAMFVPHYSLNANSIIYALKGRAWLQVVNCNGDRVFDEELEEGRVLIVPQNFAVAAKALSERFSYVAFKTNDRAAIANLVGPTSAINAMPEEVVANTFNLRKEEARKLKYNNPFQFLVPPSESENKAAA